MNATKVSTRGPATTRDSALDKTAIVIPTYNASRYWGVLNSALKQQGIPRERILIVDSSSSDGTSDLVQEAGYRLLCIPQESFRHGATRQLAASALSGTEFLVYMTQDAIPASPGSISRLLRAFDDSSVGAAYGRQLPRPEANPIERHARLFNYPSQSHVRTFSSRETLGIRAAFFSNSFAAYRRTAFEQVNGFPTNTIVSEDVSVAAKMLLDGWKVAYQSNATVFHSHPFTMVEEFSRYFDIGVHHRRERALMQEFGGPTGEGLAFVKSELKYLRESDPLLIPIATIRNFSKWCSYNLGLRERGIPLFLKKAISAQTNFWLDEQTASHKFFKSRKDGPSERARSLSK